MRIAVFRTGRHTDSQGHEKTWTEADLDRIVSQYDPAAHEAPVVIGHPRENAPAYGWVEALERVGDTLWARIKPTVAEFAEWLKAGLFKKRSISLYPDLSLRHIGFLGAQPPAVKGLPDFSFNEKEGISVEFEEGNEHEGRKEAPRPHDGRGEEKERQKERAHTHGIGAKEGGNVTKPGKYADVPDDDFGDPVNYRYPLDEEHIHAALAYWAKPHNRQQYSSQEQHKITARIVNAAKRHGVEVDEDKFNFIEKGGRMGLWEEFKGFLKGKGVDVDDASFSEERAKAAVETAVRKAKAQLEAEFAEKERGYSEKEAQLKAREEAIARRAEEARKKEVAEFCEGLKKQGQLVPAMEKLGMGITAFMQAVAGIGQTYEFAEADETGGRSKQRPYEFMRAFLSALPRAVEFAEVARDAEDDGAGDMDAMRERAIRRHMKDNGMEDDKEGKNYKKAMLAVSTKRPELFGRAPRK